MRSAIALLLVVLSASFIGACGGDDEPSTSVGPDGSTVEGTAPGDESSSDGGNGDSSSGNGDTREELDLPDRGEVSTNSAPFQKYSAKGKLHLAEFGEEASSTDLNEVQAVVTPYLDAYWAKEWDTACEYLLSETKAQLVELTKGAEGSVTGCAQALPLFANSPLARASSNGSPIYVSEGISSLRIKEGGLAGGGAGFALFHGSDGEDHWMTLKVEDGEWKLLSSSPQPFR